ncbi:MAG: PhoH family protein [Desulfonatronovibrio sp. MSAO_Bac4]|nr:MAG: PhoH family protein [Desulfonatronovibrio sp. MSAO_Bac4]
MTNNIEDFIEFQDSGSIQELFGPQGANLRILHARTQVLIEHRGCSVFLKGTDQDRLQLVKRCLIQLYNLVAAGYRINSQDVEAAIRILEDDPKADLKKVFKKEVFIVSSKKTIVPKSATQRQYLQAIKSRDLVFGVGPAGTGKTYLAVAVAVSFLTQKLVKRIILTRPAVEAGEKLGFLPGDMMEKVNPYLRPLYDALHDMLDFRKVQEMLETGVIEVAPLAFMRGRTLNDSFIILDEAQNTTPEQMKMFLTRMGLGSKAVVTGDVTQVDLPGTSISGLIQTMQVLKGIDEISFVQFNEKDVIRHSLVGRIVHAYDIFDRERIKLKSKQK